jgi:hypothetical protein
VLHEPPLQFLAIGVLLSVVFNWRGGGGPGSNRIDIAPGQIESMVAGLHEDQHEDENEYLQLRPFHRVRPRRSTFTGISQSGGPAAACTRSDSRVSA